MKTTETRTVDLSDAIAAVHEVLPLYTKRGHITKGRADKIRALLKRDPKAAIRETRHIRNRVMDERFAAQRAAAAAAKTDGSKKLQI